MWCRTVLYSRIILPYAIQKHKYFFFFFVALRPNAGHGLLILEVARSHTMTHHTRQDSTGRVIIPSQRHLPDNTRHSQETDIHAPHGIRTPNLSRRAAADLRLRPRGHWNRQMYFHFSIIFGNEDSSGLGQQLIPNDKTIKNCQCNDSHVTKKLHSALRSRTVLHTALAITNTNTTAVLPTHDTNLWRTTACQVS